MLTDEDGEDDEDQTEELDLDADDQVEEDVVLETEDVDELDDGCQPLPHGVATAAEMRAPRKKVVLMMLFVLLGMMLPRGYGLERSE